MLHLVSHCATLSFIKLFCSSYLFKDLINNDITKKHIQEDAKTLISQY